MAYHKIDQNSEQTMIIVSFCMPRSMRDELNQIAEALEISRSEFVRGLFLAYRHADQEVTE